MPCINLQGTPLPPIMASEKSQPRSATSVLNGAAIDVRSPALGTGTGAGTALSSDTGQWHGLSSKCTTFDAVRGNEPWISRQDMDPLTQLTEGQHDLAGNGDLCDRCLKILPKGCKLGKMVGEGAANTVFEFQLPDGTHLHHHNTRLLLRVAKEPVDGDRPRFNYLEQQHYYRTKIKPILGPHVMHQELVIIRNSGIIEAINDYLRHNDGKRKEKFRGTSIGQSDWGFLVEDMRPQDENGLLVEFKPKWLSQSPSAPKNAVRCRQCAKELHNYVMQPDPEKPTPTMAKPCPLTLGMDDGNRVRAESAYRLLPQLDKLGHREHLNATLNLLRDEAAFKRLRSAQEEHDTVGPLKADKSDPSFSLAMTLRDCTCFAQVTRRACRGQDSVRPSKIRFGDFDQKSPKFKVEYWSGVEEQLINGGFYTADLILCGGMYYWPPTRCVLQCPNDKRWEDLEIIHIRDMSHGKDGLTNGSATQENNVSKTHNVKTDASRLQKCLEAHKKDAPSLSPEETRL